MQGTPIKSGKEMNVLGVIFDSKLTWAAHVAAAISKSKNAIKLLKKYFNATEMRTLFDTNFYSILYYNAVIWLTPDLNVQLKQDLLSASANALRTCML